MSAREWWRTVRESVGAGGATPVTGQEPTGQEPTADYLPLLMLGAAVAMVLWVVVSRPPAGSVLEQDLEDEDG